MLNCYVCKNLFLRRNIAQFYCSKKCGKTQEMRDYRARKKNKSLLITDSQQSETPRNAIVNP